MITWLQEFIGLTAEQLTEYYELILCVAAAMTIVGVSAFYDVVVKVLLNIFKTK